MTTALANPATGIVPAPAGQVRNPRSFIPEVWDKEIGLLCRDYPYDTVMAARVLGQAVAYVITAMEKRGQCLELTPGHVVDIGVHTLILDTPTWQMLCERYNDGQFLHHVPLVEMKRDSSVMRTAEIIARNGFEVDLPLWEIDANKCGPCHPGSDSH